jgi:hypothetical protein
MAGRKEKTISFNIFARMANVLVLWAALLMGCGVSTLPAKESSDTYSEQAQRRRSGG